MLKVVWLATLVLLTGCGAGSGDDDRACTLIGCEDGPSMQLKTASGPWRDGAYAIELDLAGEKHMCTFTMTNGEPARLGSVGAITCEPSLRATWFVQFASGCREFGSQDAASQSCTREWVLQLMHSATPDTAAVRVTHDGALRLEKTVNLSYVETSPNGPECGPVCRQAQVQWTLD